MSYRPENEPFRKRPINKATMDQPQEEFIEPNASVVSETDDEYGTELEHASREPLGRASFEGWLI